MNAPDRLGLTPVLGSMSMSYSPLVDRRHHIFGTRLTMLSVKPQDRLPVGLVVEQLNGLWPESKAPVLLAPLDLLDESLLTGNYRQRGAGDSDDVRDPDVQRAAARRAGIRMARRRPDVPLPPAAFASNMR
jgi:hypothetical protein